MLRTRPLTYIEPSGGTISSDAIFISASASGTVGKWAPIQMVALLDPSGANTVASVTEAMNNLMWRLGQTQIATVEPRIWFGAAGEGGVRLSVNTGNAVSYIPYSTAGVYTYKTISSVIAVLNNFIGITGAQFRYDGTRAWLIVKSGTTIRFTEASNAAYGASRRCLNRLFAKDIGGEIGKLLSGNTLIQGQPIVEPMFGVFSPPAAVANIQISNTTQTSFQISWSGSPTPDVSYYVRVSGNGIDYMRLVGGTSTTVGTTDGLQSGVSYTVTVVATTPYEVSVSKPYVPASLAPSTPVPTIVSAAAIDPFSAKITIAATADPTGISRLLLTFINVATLSSVTADLPYSGTEYITSILSPNISYTLEARFKMSTGVEGAVATVAVSTPTLPSATARFGVSTPVDYRNILTTTEEELVYSGMAYGFRAYAGTSWIGYEFNRIIFPYLPLQGFNLNSIFSDFGNGQLKINIYSDSGLSTLIASSDTEFIQNANTFREYKFILSPNVVLKPNMVILVTLNAGGVSFRIFKNTGSPAFPLEGLYSPDSSMLIKHEDSITNEPLCIHCDFALE
jgi:hypothetical protein